MEYSIGTALSGSGEIPQQQLQDASPRRRRLYELIINGFEHLLSQQGYTRIDVHGSGYVVWIPRREQYGKQHQRRICDGEAEGEQGEDGSPLVLYGGGYDGLFSGALQQALGCCDCLSPPLRWVRIPLELLPPPAHPPSRSSSAKQAAAQSAGRPREGSAEHSSGPLSAPRSHDQGKIKKLGLLGMKPEPGGGRGAARIKPSRVVRDLGEGCPERGGGGRGGARKAGLSREGRCGREGDSKEKDDPRETGNRVVGDGHGGRRVRQREMVDLWWLTDPPAPKVSAEALRLRVATETVQTLPGDVEETPDVVCTIEVCQGRPYLPGRLQRYPNVATSTGPYRAVHSYRVLPSGTPRSAGENISPGAGGSTADSGGSVFSAPGPSAASPWRRSGGERGKAEEEVLACVSVIDVKPSHWYNVRHRFCWRVGGGSSLEGVEEVVTASRHVHTEAFFPPVPRPPRPYAILGCSRRQPHDHQQHGDRRLSREQAGRRDDEGLAFHFRLRWGAGGRGAGRNDGRGFGQGSAPQEIEYVLQESMLQPPGTIGGSTASAKKARGSSATAGGGGGVGTGLGGSRPNSNLRATTGTRSPKPGGATKATASTTKHNATWSAGGLLGWRETATTAAPEVDDDNDPFSKQLLGGSEPEKSGNGGRDGESVWGPWRTVRRTRKTREAVELPPSSTSTPPSFREGRGVPGGLRYRVGARRREAPQKAVFSEMLEVPTALLARLYEIEEISATRRPLLSATTPSSKKRTVGGARPESSARGAGRDRAAGRTGGLEDDEAANFLRAFEMSEDEDSFPTRVAWELQSEFWSQQQAVEEGARSSRDEEEEKEKEAGVQAEAKSIQCTLGIPVNTKYIADIIRKIDATAGG